MVIVQHQVVGHSCLHPQFFFKIINHSSRTHNSLSQNVAITWSVSGKSRGYTCNIQDCGQNLEGDMTTNAVITLWVLFTKHQTITLIMNNSDKLQWLPTEFINFWQWV
jgi:hypothetical protein